MHKVLLIRKLIHLFHKLTLNFSEQKIIDTKEFKERIILTIKPMNDLTRAVQNPGNQNSKTTSVVESALG